MSAEDLSRVFAALADPTRRDIVARLAGADRTVNELAANYPITLQAVYKHLTVLTDAGVVSRPGGRQPRRVHLEVDVFALITGWITRYQQQAEERYQRLDTVLASMTDRPDPPPPPDHRRCAPSVSPGEP